MCACVCVCVCVCVCLSVCVSVLCVCVWLLHPDDANDLCRDEGKKKKKKSDLRMKAVHDVDRGSLRVQIQVLRQETQTVVNVWV